jgi:hypothetical protein
MPSTKKSSSYDCNIALNDVMEETSQCPSSHSNTTGVTCKSIMTVGSWGNKQLCLRIQRDPELCVEGEECELLDTCVWKGRMCTIHDNERKVTRVVYNVVCVPKDWNLSVLSHATVCYVRWRRRSYRESERERERERERV